MPLDESARRLIALSRQQNHPSLGTVPISESRRLANEWRAQLQPVVPAIPAVEDIVIPVRDAELPCRRYRAQLSDSGVPVVLFFHGGGFVLGDLESHDVVCRLLCDASGCDVISVGYRCAPEYRFPTAVCDAVDAAAWVHQHAAALGIDAVRIAVAGDSAGANLATVLCLARRVEGLAPFALQLLLYPVTDQFTEYDSKRRFAQGYLLSRAAIEFYAAQYFEHEQDRRDWRASPLLCEDVSGVPEALVITAGYDPLVDEGEAYALRLAQAGVRTTIRRYPGQVHGFVSRGGVIPEAGLAIADMAQLLRARFF